MINRLAYLFSGIVLLAIIIMVIV